MPGKGCWPKGRGGFAGDVKKSKLNSAAEVMPYSGLGIICDQYYSWGSRIAP